MLKWNAGVFCDWVPARQGGRLVLATRVGHGAFAQGASVATRVGHVVFAQQQGQPFPGGDTRAPVCPLQCLP